MRALARVRMASHHGGMSALPPELSPIELYRLIANMIRFGRVEDVRPGSSSTPATCTVRLSDDLVTTHIQWISLAAGGVQHTRHWRPPVANEPCLVLAPEGDLNHAVALLGLFSSDMPQASANLNAERHDFSGSEFWEYERTTGTLVFNIANAITLNVGGSQLHITPDGTTLTTPNYKVDSPASTFTGAVTVDGLLTYNAGMAGSAGAGGSNTIQGGFAVDGGSITHNGKNIGSSHTHPDAHGGNTGAPN